MLTTTELCEKIIARMDADELIERMEPRIEDVVWNLMDLIDDNRHRFIDIIEEIE